MLISAHALKGYHLDGLDGVFGKVHEFYFDDRRWTIRYLVADTGSWLTDQKVLVSPYSLIGFDRSEHQVDVALTKRQIKECPSLDSDIPVSRQFEEAYNSYYGLPAYWAGGELWGGYPYPVRDREKWAEVVHHEHAWDPNLRSTAAVTGYHLQAADGEIGHVEDFIVDDETWEIRYLVVATKNWWPGRKVLIAPLWIERVSWTEAKVYTDLTRESVQHSPPYTESALLNREYEESLYGHYGRPEYWVESSAV